MKDANPNIKFAQLMPEYVPGMREDEKTALEAMTTAKAHFEQRRDHYEELASKHKFFADEAASSADESRKVKLKIRANLRNSSEYSHKELITLRAEMRESLEMMENYLFLADECSGSTAEAKTLAEHAANKYRGARAAAIGIISDNMLEAAIGAANSLFMAIHVRVTAFQEMHPMEITWNDLKFDSAESAVLADVNKRIAQLYRSLDEDYMKQMLPPPINVPFDVGDLGEGTPAAWHMARVANEANLDTSAI